MSKFKKGDKVVALVNNYCIKKGMVGTVLQDNSICPFVEWENLTKGHDGPYFDGRRSCWALIEGEMELVKPSFNVGFRVKEKFKVGDIVRIVRKTGHAYANFPLGIKAKVIAEKESGSVWDYIVQLTGEGAIGWTHDHIYHNCQNVKAADLELVKEKFKLNIVIYRKDNKVIAQLHNGKGVYASAEAKCSPEDTFDFFIGSQIALQRLIAVCKDEMLSHVNLVMPTDYPVGKIITYEL